MNALSKRMIMVVGMLALAAQSAWAQGSAQAAAAASEAVAYGTTGACKNAFPGGPCTQTSTLVQIDPETGALLKTIGPVGYTVNGLAFDRTGRKLYASTAIGDVVFHGLITIDLDTGAGTPVAPKVDNFGLVGPDSPIHSIAVDPLGQMVGWYDEFALPGAPPVTDTFVRINEHTGVATEFTDTGIDTFQNGLAFQTFGVLGVLWNIDSPKRDSTGAVTQTIYALDPLNGRPVASRNISPPTIAALGDFNPVNHLYYGLKFAGFDPTPPTIIVIDPIQGTATRLADTVPDLHVLAFVKPAKP